METSITLNDSLRPIPAPPIEKRYRCAECRSILPIAYIHKASWKYDGYGHFCTKICAALYANRQVDKENYAKTKQGSFNRERKSKEVSMWWGWRTMNGSIDARRFLGTDAVKRDTDLPFIKTVTLPFKATTKDKALKEVAKLTIEL